VDAVGALWIYDRVRGILICAFRQAMTNPASRTQIAAIYTRLRILNGQNIMVAMAGDATGCFSPISLRNFCMNACLERCDLLRMTTTTAGSAELTRLDRLICSWRRITDVAARATHIRVHRSPKFLGDVTRWWRA
jgi:hypothetical protein